MAIPTCVLFVILILAYFGAVAITKRAAQKGEVCIVPFVLREDIVPMAYSWEVPLDEYPYHAVNYILTDANGNETSHQQLPGPYVARYRIWFFGARMILHEETIVPPGSARRSMRGNNPPAPASDMSLQANPWRADKKHLGWRLK